MLYSEGRASVAAALVCTPMTRRELLGLFAGATAAAAHAGSGERRDAAEPVSYRRYRADATILLFSIPIYSRSGVGGGWAASASEGPKRRLSFAAGSEPARARGLNRLGYIEEEVLESGAAVERAAYFGFMTSSREDSIDEARRALESKADAVPYEAIQGNLRPGDCRNRGACFACEPGLGWSNLETIKVRALEAVGAAGDRPVDARAPVPFLFALTRAMHARGRKLVQPFVYGAHPHELQTEKHPDEGAGQRFARAGFACDPERIYKIDGRIRDLVTGKQNRFSLWFEEGCPVPLRFDVKVRSFLRLTFEAERHEA